MNLINHLTRTTLMSAMLTLVGAGTALADGNVAVIGASGGGAIPASTAGGAWTTLSGPAITNLQADAISGSGTLVLTVPAGFEFNPSAAVTAVVTPTGSIKSGTPDPVTLPVTVTPTNLTAAIPDKPTLNSAGACTLVFQNIQVRPTAGFPLASGYLTQSGTGSFQDIVNLTGNWGFLREVGGSLFGYVITGTNDSTAGSPISITIQKVDEFGNPLNDSTTETLIFSGIGTIGINAPSINGSTDAFTTGISITFDSNGAATVTLVDYLAGTGTLNATDGTYTAGTGLPITVVAGPVSSLSITDAPGTVAYGSSFTLAASTTDQYGNPSTLGLGTSVEVTLSLTSGAGALAGYLTQDIGTSAGNGAATFTGIQISAAGNNDVLSASAVGLTAGTAIVTVTPLVVTPSVVVSDKVYDGTTDATIFRRSLSGVLGTDDVNLGTSGMATISDKHVGSAKPVLVTGLALSGSAAGNYQLSANSFYTTANILPRPLHVAATCQTKLYDGTVASTAMPAIVFGSLVTGDTCSLGQHFNDKAVGQGNALIPIGAINDGNGGLDYTISFVVTNGAIDPRPIVATGVADTKLYDGTISSAGIPTITGTLASGDSPNFTQVFDNKNTGTGKTLIPIGSVNDGNGGHNYVVTFVSATAGTIAPRSLTVTAVSDSKNYDGNNNSAATPVVTSGSLLGSDTAGFLQSFDNKNVGTGKMVIPTGSVNDGNGGNNYVLILASINTGSIAPRALIVSATGVNKVYDGTTAATVALSDNRIAGDSLTDSYASASFADATIGNNKPVQVSGISISGIDAGNYSPNTSTATLANIAAANSAVSLTSSKNPIQEGANVTFTATLSGMGTTSALPTGTVQFYSNGQPLGSPVALNSGTATLSSSQLAAGSNTVSAVYLGDNSFQGSSASLMQAVQMNITGLTILSIVNNGDGTTTITCQGVPATSYVVQASTALSAPTAWETFSTNLSGYIDGKWTVVDDMTQHEHRFFRLVKF